MSLGSISPILSGAGAPVSAPAAIAPIATIAQPSATAAAADQSTALQTPLQAILSSAIDAAIPAQDGMAGLMANLAAATGPNSSLPPAAQATIQQILTLLTPLNGAATSDQLQSAVASSGVFFEAMLAAALTTPNAAPPDVSADLKALLLQLPADLAAEMPNAALQAQAAAPPPRPIQTPARGAARPPPPGRGAATRGQPARPASFDPEEDEASLGHTLGQQAQAALARLRLSQIASLPKPGEPTSWRFELPVSAPDGRAVAQFDVRREQSGRGQGRGAEATWRARFSLDVEPSGPVHAEVVLSGGKTHVTLWAENEAAQAALGQGQPELIAALNGDTGAEAAVRVLPGSPPAPEGAAGQLVDRRS